MPNEETKSLQEQMAENRLENLDLNEEEIEELAWMDYEGLLDMKVEFRADLGQTSLTIKEVLALLNLLVKVLKPMSTTVLSVKARLWFMKRTLLFVSMKYLTLLL